MKVETYVDQYSDWIRGEVIKTNNNSHSVEILLDKEQDIQEIGKVHIKGTDEQTKIRADPNPINNVSSSSPIKSILKNSPIKSRRDDDASTDPSISADIRKSPMQYYGPSIPVEDLPIIERLARGARMRFFIDLSLFVCSFVYHTL